MSTPAGKEITLYCGRLTLALAPVAGGSVASFLLDGLPLFRTCTPTARRGYEPLALAGFPLVPFASRIQGNGFEWRGGRVNLAPNMPGEPFAIHGHGWRRPWEVASVKEHSCRLKFDHPAAGSAKDAGDGWLWHYRAEQIFELTKSALRLTLALTNLSDSDMPGGLGWHPYIYRGDARLTAQTQGRIRGAGDPAGDRRIRHRGFTSAAVEDLDVDHGFYGWSGTAEISWPARSVSLTLTAAPPLSFLVVYTPPGQDYFCVEPMSHLPDAGNWQDDLPNGWHTIRPGNTLRATIEVHILG
jgi:aldose 1-epimerase